jgi:glutathione reductase (NADPH)
MVGGGYIAVEFAGIFRGLGAEVTLSIGGSEILRGFDDDVRKHLRGEIEARGIKVLLRNDITAIEKHGHGYRVRTSDVDITVDCDCVMFATGRLPNTAGLGLESVGVRLDGNGAVIVDEHGRSSVESIFAVGDVTHRVQLTPVAIREGSAVANTLFNNRPMTASHHTTFRRRCSASRRSAPLATPRNRRSPSTAASRSTRPLSVR